MRFNLFESNWHEIEISTLIKEVNVKTSDFITYPLYSFTIEDGVTPKTDRYKRGFLVKKEGELFKIINNNNFIMNPMNLRFGAINFSRINKPVSVSGYYDIFTIDNCNYNHFWNAYFKNNKTLHRYNQIATGSLEEKKRVYFNQFIKMKFKVPNNDEKRKINELISLIEQRVLTQKKIIEDLNTLIDSIIDRLFFDNDYNVKLSDVITQSTNRNKNELINCVSSVSNKYGFIKQSEQFEDRDVASDDLTNYKVITLNDFGYNPARINVGSIARYKNTNNTVVSPMYICFKCVNNLYPEYLEYYFKSKEFKIHLLRRLEGSVRQCLTFESMQNIPFHLPDLDEQKKNAKIISVFFKKIQLETSILSKLILQKDYLLSKMFI